MMIEVLKSKLHCVRVTEANLNYMGSITIDEDLMDAAKDVYKRQPSDSIFPLFCLCLYLFPLFPNRKKQ